VSSLIINALVDNRNQREQLERQLAQLVMHRDTLVAEAVQARERMSDITWASGLGEVEVRSIAALSASGQEVTHLIADGEAVTFCCGRTPFELPRTDRLTVDRALAGGCAGAAGP
jgi:hypothetical protein